MLGNETRFRKVLKSEVAELAALIKEPYKIAQERDSLLNQKQVLEDALTQMPYYLIAGPW